MKYILLTISLSIASISSFANGLENLPQEIKTPEIAKYLGLIDLVKLSSTSKEMRKSFNSSWKEIFEVNLGDIENQDPKSYLPGESKEDENIDWLTTLIDTANDVVQNNINWLKNNQLSYPSFFKTKRQKFLVGADLRGFHFYSTNLNGVNFTNANLEGAVLTEAKLTGAILKNANLKKARLNRANLTNAVLVGAEFDFVSTLKGAYYVVDGREKPVTLEWLRQKGATWDFLNQPEGISKN